MADKQIVEANLRRMTGTGSLDLPAYIKRLCQTDNSSYQEADARFYSEENGRIKYFSEFPIHPEDYIRPQLRLGLTISHEGKFSVNRVLLPRNAPAEMRENLEATIKVYNERFGLTEIGDE